MDPTTILLFIAGLALLIIGAEVLVRGASRLASAVGIPPLVIGLTVVAFGTSSPELAVSVQASWTGRPDVAVGNVVGSNIFNVLFILGLAAAIVPLVVAQQLVRWEVPLLIGVSVLFWLLASDGLLGRVDGTVLFAGIVTYTVFAIRQSRRETAAIRAEYAQVIGGSTEPAGRLAVQVVLILVGLALLVVGSHWLVEGATAVARTAGLSELVVGLTIVAAGTSLPEVATSVLASIRGERDIAVGNAIGSSLFNLLCVLGLSALVAPAGISVADATLGFDIPVMVAVAVAVCRSFLRAT